MAYNLTYSDLSETINLWQGFPLSLSGDEVMPLDYRAGMTGWVLYGKKLGKKELSCFQREFIRPIVIVSAWKIRHYQVVHIAGELSSKAKKIAEKLKLDVASINNIPSLNMPGLLLMDMDSTAIEIECIDEIAKLAGVGEEVTKITEQAMQGELDFATSLRKRVTALKGTPVSVLHEIKDQLPMMSGLTHLVRQLHKMNWHVAIATGGFTYYADALKERLKLVETTANELEIANDQLTGNLIGDIVDAKGKAQFLLKLSEQLSIPLTQTVAIGDGANDLNMLQTAALGIAYHAKPIVAKKSNANIHFADLTGVLCILSASLDNKR